MSNFRFLQAEWRSLYRQMKLAEARVYTEPVSAATYCRMALEQSIHRLYEEERIEKPYNKDLVSLMTEEDIKAIIPYHFLQGLHVVRKHGNRAVHYGQRLRAEEALVSIKHLYGFLKWFALQYSREEPDLPGSFDLQFVPKLGERERKLREQQEIAKKAQEDLQARLEEMERQHAALLEKAKRSDQALVAFKEKEAAEKAALAKRKQSRRQHIPSEFTEAQTRRHLIDAMIREAGWEELQPGRELEYPVQGMPVTRDNPKGNGYVDYVLWDHNGKPLALLEAKRTSKKAETGRHQAFLYANCLEQMHGQRPIIFYSNGFETYIWDDVFYSAPRRVYGFYSRDELQWAIHQRKNRLDPRQATVNPNIAGRPYQLEAIQRVTESLVVGGPTGLRGNKRNALLVMATGSGKTRTAAALVEVLFKHHWVKRVLFLADRNALVSQAKRSFGEHLPSYTAIDLTQEAENEHTRLVFSTYPSMLNRIDSSREKGKRTYGVGHFDLIIIDEAHRSVYNRYKAIFEYFDALLIGLTATPKDSIDHNTFELFGCSNDDPTYAFELEEAVPTYLKPYKNVDASTQFVREGIKYKQLSPKEQAKYEETFRDETTGLFPEEIEASALNKWLFNKDTVYKVLDKLMLEGLKIEGGDKLGRTIIFAANQKHAAFIVDCFMERFPGQPSGFIQTVHNGISHAQSLITAFCHHHEERLPQIAVSVDMMDTGIDAPRVLNLVFFKQVRSYAKFWQMIGRGTRLCPDIFGPGQDKEHFLIFDVCQNFEFFEVNKKGTEGKIMKTLSQRIFEARLQLSKLLRESGEEAHLEMAKDLLDGLHGAIDKLDREHFQVQMAMRYVSKFEKRERWNNLSDEDTREISDHLSALPPPEKVDESARRFDLLMLRFQISMMLEGRPARRFQNNLVIIAEQLSGKYTIPEVNRSKALIERMRDPDFYKNLSQKQLDKIREEIRMLIQHLESDSIAPIYTDIQDENLDLKTGTEPLPTYGRPMYKKRVERFLRENKHNLTIRKLSTNTPITATELQHLEDLLFDGKERGTRQDFVEAYGEQPLGEFVRSILGLEVEAAQQAFAEFLQTGSLSADQMTFIQNIITYLTKNGTIDKRMLFEAPFTHVHDQGLLGVFGQEDAGKIIQIIDSINKNVDVG